MAIDLELFKLCDSPKVRIYSWKNKCISYGYSQKIDELIDIENARKDGWEIVKRPTGGGIVSHGTDEVTYSVVCPIQLLPEGLMGAYYYISGIIVKALKRLSVDAKIGRGARGIGYRQRTNELCFSNTREYEITFDGK